MTPPAISHADNVHEAIQRISAAGYKATTPRVAVLNAASTYVGAFTAAELAQTLATQGHPLGDASLFRTLKLYTDIGVMQRIHGLAECHRYIMSNHQHAHRIVCTICGRVTEFAECGLDVMIRALEAQTGYRVVEHLLELFGTCPGCMTVS
ncbi:MAG: transcriptional repressor [Chloroflexi bacterium]|jgi:Fur family transcriptional regulator, ferric uptake regulator|nr:MAG: transcriptional repressor [Chloroflexota bacterium]